MADQQKEWKGLKNIVMEKKTLEKGTEKKTEYRYFISSLPCEIETVAKAVRGALECREHALASGCDIL